MADDGSTYEVGETSTKNQTADVQATGNGSKYKVGKTSTENQKADGISVLASFLRFKKAVEDLKRQREELISAQERLRFFVEAAKRHNEGAEDAEKWLTEADDALDDAQILLETEMKEKKRLFFNNWRWRYQLSEKVANWKQTVTALVSRFKQVRPHAKISGHEFFLSDSEGLFLFDTHLLALNRITDAFKDESVYLIGLIGEAGIGKTSLAREVEKMAVNSKLFNEVVMVELSVWPDIKSIQDKIAGSLQNFTFDDNQGAYDRNNQLNRRLRSREEKVLIIVDDLWREKDLMDIGIPAPREGFDNTDLLGPGSKILFTSRVGVHYNSSRAHEREMMVRLDRLTDAEPQYLFKITAGLNRTSSASDEKAIDDIVKKCNGLPIAIQVAAKALRGRTPEEWKEASTRLNGGKTLEEWQRFCQILRRPELIDESLEKVYYGCSRGQLQLSYDRLSLETKKCFFVLSIFPEDDEVHIEDLVGCAVGKDFKGYNSIDYDNSIDYYRRIVLGATRELKSSRMLHDDVREYILKMTKMIHDAAPLIASNEVKFDFKIRSGVPLEELRKNQGFESYTAISMLSTKTEELEEGFESAKLHVLVLGDQTISRTSKFFEALTALKVLILTGCLLSLRALQSLTDLRVLRLKECGLEDISSLEMLKRLEILSFRGSDITELPKEMGELDSLRLLDLSECQELQKIHPNVIRRLSRLEELLIGGSFENWQLEEKNEEDRNASLSELKALEHLNALSLKFSSAHLPKDFVFPRLKYFQIAMNEKEGTLDQDCYYPKSLKVSTTSSLDAFKELFPNLIDLHLSCITDYQNGLLPSFNLSLLCFLTLTGCPDMECIVDATKEIGLGQALLALRVLSIEDMTNLEALCKGHKSGHLLFLSLETLTIKKCPKLIVAVPAGRGVADPYKLQEVRVEDCDQMEQVFKAAFVPNPAGSGRIIPPSSFPNLTNLELVKLPKLKEIWFPDIRLWLPRLSILVITDCPELRRVFPILMSSEVRNDYLPEYQRIKGLLKGLPPINPCNGFQTEEIQNSFNGLKLIGRIIKDMAKEERDKTYKVQQPNILVQRNTNVLPQLRRLVLRRLGKLEEFCGGMGIITLPCLEELVVEFCPHLLPFVIVFDATKQFHLKELTLSRVGYAYHAVKPDGPEISSTSEYLLVGNCTEIFQVARGFFFSELQKLVVNNIPRLEVLWDDPTQILTFQNLTEFELVYCEGVVNIFSLMLARNLPKLKSLKVEECNKLEHIVTPDDVQVASSSKAYSRNVYFPKLKSIHVKTCRKLKALFPICVADLPELEEFRVEFCHSLKEIFAHEGEANVVADKDEMVLKSENEVKLAKLKVPLPEDLQDKDEMLIKLELPKLRVLHLHYLPDLLSIIPMGYYFKFPSLSSDPTIKECRKLSTTFLRDLNKTMYAKTKKSELQKDALREFSINNNGDIDFGS